MAKSREEKKRFSITACAKRDKCLICTIVDTEEEHSSSLNTKKPSQQEMQEKEAEEPEHGERQRCFDEQRAKVTHIKAPIVSLRAMLNVVLVNCATPLGCLLLRPASFLPFSLFTLLHT